MDISPIDVDQETVAIPLRVPGSEVVLLQAFFELYEGPGTVRTVDIRSSLICIITTKSMVSDCIDILEAIQGQIQWRFAPGIEDQIVQDLLHFR